MFSYILSLSRHHCHKLVKVQSPGAIPVNFLDDAIKVVFGQFVVQLPENLLEGVRGDGADLVLVVIPENKENQKEGETGKYKIEVLYIS